MRTLIVGASGQVGGLLLRRCRALGWPCTGTAFRHAGEALEALDIRDAEAVRALVGRARPEVIFLPGALTAVDYAEEHRQECLAINVDGTANVARAAGDEAGAVLVFFSTEQVFRDSPDQRREDEPTDPLHVYGLSKVLGEQRVREILPERHLILRTSWVFGPELQRKNFIYRAVRTLRAGQRLAVPRDQLGQPTYSVDLAETALALLAGGQRGTFHALGPQLLTRLALAELVAEVFGLDAGLIDGQTTSELKQPAPRPLRVCLSRQKLLAALGRDPIRPPRAALEDLRDNGGEYRP